MASLQKGQQSGSLPVESTGNVLDDLVVFVVDLEVLDLAFEIFLLVLRRDSGVDDLVFRFNNDLLIDKTGFELLSVVKTLPSGQSDTIEFSIFSPVSKSRGVDLDGLSDLCRCHIRHRGNGGNTEDEERRCCFDKDFCENEELDTDTFYAHTQICRQNFPLLFEISK